MLSFQPGLLVLEFQDLSEKFQTLGEPCYTLGEAEVAL